MSKVITPNYREGLSAQNEITGQNEYLYSSNHALNVNVTGGGSSNVQYQEGDTSAPATGTVTLGRYLASPPGTLSDGALSAPLMDNYGQLKVVPVGTLTVSNVGASNFVTGQVALSSTATQIVSSRSTRRSITIVNLSTTDMYIGSSGVTTSNGQLLLGVKGTAITLEVIGAVYGIVTTGTPSVSYEEEYS